MPKLTKAQQSDRDDARDTLRTLLAPNGTEHKIVYSINRHTSRSGMLRHLDFYVCEDGDLRYLTGLIADAMQGWYTRDRDGSLKVDGYGCGMDMGFSVVYSLGACLWPNGTPAPHGTRNGEPDTAGGYAIRHEWL